MTENTRLNLVDQLNEIRKATNEINLNKVWGKSGKKITTKYEPPFQEDCFRIKDSVKVLDKPLQNWNMIQPKCSPNPTEVFCDFSIKSGLSLSFSSIKRNEDEKNSLKNFYKILMIKGYSLKESEKLK